MSITAHVAQAFCAMLFLAPLVSSYGVEVEVRSGGEQRMMRTESVGKRNRQAVVEHPATAASVTDKEQPTVVGTEYLREIMIDPIELFLEQRSLSHAHVQKVPMFSGLTEFASIGNARSGNVSNSSGSGGNASSGGVARDCVDAPDSGVRFRTGEKAQCDELYNYCNHPALGDQIRAVCVKTCAQCALEYDDSGLNLRPECVDKPRDASPVFTMHGVVLECSNITEFCEDHVDAEKVRAKCRRSCQACGVFVTTAEPSVAPVVAASANSNASSGSNSSNGSNSSQVANANVSVSTAAPDSTSWTQSTMLQDNFEEGKDAVMGCSRRRRWGFCYSRRRRWQ